MQHLGLRHIFLGCAAVLGCASPIQQRTIEPPPPGGGGGESHDDAAFVLSRKPAQAERRTDDIPINIADTWWKFRASYLKVSEAEAKERDAGISEKEAPDHFWDDQTSVEAVSVWTALCNECHGGRRHVEDATTMPAPPPRWGRREGLFFGARRKYADVFAVVYKGGPERNGVRSDMPAWRGKLAKEMIWSLLYFLEYQSGGIEGRFPPSLYPRLRGEAKDALQ